MFRYIEIVDIAFRYRCIESYCIGLGRFNNFLIVTPNFCFRGSVLFLDSYAGKKNLVATRVKSITDIDSESQKQYKLYLTCMILANDMQYLP